MPWCPRCATGISDMEINEGRWKVQHTSVYVRLPLVDRAREYLLVWTTTPWTLPANVAAAVNPDLDYAKVEQDGDYYYLVRRDALVAARLNDKLRGHEHGEVKVVGTLKGAEHGRLALHRPLRRAARVAERRRRARRRRLGRGQRRRGHRHRAYRARLWPRGLRALQGDVPGSPCSRRWTRAASTSAATTG